MHVGLRDADAGDVLLHVGVDDADPLARLRVGPRGQRRNTTVATSSTGTVDSATSASSTSVTSSATATPTTVIRLTTACASPVCRNAESASTSVVIRVMIRPDSSRS